MCDPPVYVAAPREKLFSANARKIDNLLRLGKAGSAVAHGIDNVFFILGKCGTEAGITLQSFIHPSEGITRLF